jgi:hypothetical protein
MWYERGMESTPSSTPTSAAPVHVPKRGCGSVLAGIVLVLIGIPKLVCPGPGIASIAAGVGMIAIGLGISRRGPS